MTKAKRPAKTPAILAPEPGARDRVRERMRQMAKLALLAATPLTNAACDPAVPPSPFGAGGAGGGGGLPTPTCEKSAADWAQFIHAEAAWGTEASERIVLLTVTNPEDKPWLQAPGSYTIEGGTLLPSTAREPDVLRIKPDAGATIIRLQGTATCHIIAEPMTIAITLTTANTNPFVVITTG
jgi:hypothetical protein